MTIEFADPGYNWAFVWWPLGILVFTITVFVLASRTKEVNWDMGHWIPSVLGPLMIVSAFAVPVVAWGVHSTDYDIRVSIEAGRALVDEGFGNVVMFGDRFTASTEDGQYFRGVLVDLRPESGYAYEVLELTGTEN